MPLRWKRRPPADSSTRADSAGSGQGRRVSRRREFLEPFGLLMAALLVLALGLTSLIGTETLRGDARRTVSDQAPATMAVMTRIVRARVDSGPAGVQEALTALVSLPNVRHCRFRIGDAAWPNANAVAAGAATATTSARPPSLEARSHAAVGAVVRTLKSDIHTADGSLVGSLEVDFGAPSLSAIPLVLWTTAGLVAVGALGAFWMIYRIAARRARPLDHVRENLLAFHKGTERSLELLALRDQLGGVSEAWNRLVAFVGQMQREVDAHRCREVVVSSIQSLHSQSSQAILDALPIGVMRIDAAGLLGYANYSAMHVLGIREEGTTGPALAERLADAALAEAVLSLRDNSGGAGLDYPLESEGQTIVRLLSIEAGTEDEDELVVMVQDISQLKNAERAREEFLAHITHELRTPLTNIRAYTETLNQDFFDDEQTRRECYNVVMSETRRLNKLIEDVLSASQMDAGVVRFEREPVRVDELLRQAVQEVQASADAKSQELVLRVPSKLPTVLGDTQRLHQACTNLVGNAIKYTPKGGTVGVEASAAEGVLKIRVSDTGIGIPPECHDKIFEKFFRVSDPSVNAEEGTGLGLGITREIIRLHGGAISVESVPGDGATFIVELPLQDSQTGAQAPEVSHGAHSDR